MAKTVSAVILSGANYIDSLLSFQKWSNTALTFSFRTTAPNSPYADGFAECNSAQKTAVREALAKWSALCKLTFTEVEDSSASTLRFGTCSSTVVPTSEAYFPSTSENGGNVWFGNSNSNSPNSPEQGNYDYETILHEIGHALSLKHPHEMEYPNFPVADTSLDAMQYTVMSYRSFVGGNAGYTNAVGSYAYGPMIDDIAAVQYLYGANYNYNSGNSMYSFNPAESKIFRSCWDGGGIDTFDCSLYANSVMIQLEPGYWSTFSSSQLANLGNGHIAPGNVQNSYLYNNNSASLIENANGGAGDDTLRGNQTSNSLRGNAGNDQLYGETGNDQLWGGLGADTMNGGSESDAFWWGKNEGNDQIVGTNASDALYLYNFSFNQRIAAIESDGNLVFGCLTGDSARIAIRGWSELTSTTRLQTIVFNEGGTLKAYAWNAHAAVNSSLANEALSMNNVRTLRCVDSSDSTLTGSSGNDILQGGTGSDAMKGDAGNDGLYGSAGNDTLTGGLGEDSFYWGKNDDNDTIVDGGAGDTVMLYSAGLSNEEVSIAVSGSTLQLMLPDSVLTIQNWQPGGMNKFVFGMNPTTNNTFSITSIGSNYSWHRS